MEDQSKENKTAIEWLLGIILKNQVCIRIGFQDEIKQAKEMERQNAESVWKASAENMHRQFSSSAYKPITFEQYYNETFNK